MNSLVDTYKRKHETLRVSVTDRCQMRCQYCLPNGAPPPMPRSSILSFEEIAKIVGIFAGLGVTRVRLTGGEPLLRRDLERLVRMISSIDTVSTIALTTNALLLEKHLGSLADAGLTQISISLDAAEAEEFEKLTGLNSFDRVTQAIRTASQFPNLSVEINAVAIRGVTENQLDGLLSLSRDHCVAIRFIELMPFEDVEWSREKLLTGEEILSKIESLYGPDSYDKIDRSRPSAPSRRFRFRDGAGGFGLIEPVSRPFCEKCDRLRLRSDGMLYNCLFNTNGFDLRSAVRSGNDDLVRKRIKECVRSKSAGGMLDLAKHSASPPRIMASIGG